MKFTETIYNDAFAIAFDYILLSALLQPLQRNADDDDGDGDDIVVFDVVVVLVSCVDDCGGGAAATDTSNNEEDDIDDDDCADDVDDDKTVNEGIFKLIWSVLDEFGALIMIDGTPCVSDGKISV